MDKLTLQQAAIRLGISEGAARKRFERGTLKGERDQDGRIYVWVDTGETDRPEAAGELAEELRRQNEYLRQQLDAEREARTEERRRADAVIAQLSQANAEQARTIRAIEPASEATRPQEGPEARSEGYNPRQDSEAPESAARRPWWRRLIGG